ncbi:MAG: Ig-like domain-containing protein [Anaerolineae bacterium]|nr:Ig-like domain-containing protein [Thermoflexales bacterium]MDW8407237.1 Ig-like domain-containing protein [Anaerolineae bacterium]
MKLDRLDAAALSALAVLMILIGVIVWRGDQVGVQIVRRTPAPDAQSVALRPTISFSFSEAMRPSSLEGRLEVTPLISGALRWDGNTVLFIPATPLQPNTVYTVTIRAGAHSEQGRPVLRDMTWSFRTGRLRVVYLSPALDPGDLYVLEIDAAASPRRLTAEPYGVFDFAISPDGRHIVYSAARDESGARDLWLIRLDGSQRELLVECNQQVCQSASWAADGIRVAFERRALVDGPLGRSPGPAHIWVVDITTRQVAPLFIGADGDAGPLGALPRWAPSGDRLSYYDPLASAVTVVDTRSGERVQLPSALGDSGAWSPDARELIFPDLLATDAGQFSQMLRADLISRVMTPVTVLTTTNDSSVAWSPAGDWIAFARKTVAAGVGFFSIGSQVWISRPDGSALRPLTAQPEYSYGGLSWSPDGRWIVAVRNLVQAPNGRPEIWLIRADGQSDEHRVLVTDATIPAWVP